MEIIGIMLALLAGTAPGDVGDDAPELLVQAWTLAGPNSSSVHGVGFTPDGDLAAVGTFSGPISWEDETWPAPDDRRDALVARFSREGQLRWLHTLFSDTHRRVTAQCVVSDSAGGIYAGGWFEGVTVFDDDTEIVSLGGADAFLMYFSPEGPIDRVQRFRGSGSDHIMGVAVDSADAVYMTGHFANRINMDPGEESHFLESEGATDGFVAKLDADGAFQWALPVRGPSAIHCRDIAVGPNGTVFVAGQFRGALSAGAYTIAAQDGVDAFAAAIDADGAVLWLRPFTSEGDAAAASVAVSDAGSVEVTGHFTESLSVGDAQLISEGLKDSFVVTMDDGGAVIQARSMAGATPNDGIAVTTDTRGNTYVTGQFMQRIDGNPGGEPIWLDTMADGNDAYLARYHADGTFQWVGQIGSTRETEPKAIVTHHDGTVAWGGLLRREATIRAYDDTLSVSALSGSDAFIAVLSGPPRVTLTSPEPAHTPHQRIPVTVTFSHSVTGFAASDIVVSNGVVDAFQGEGATYHIELLAHGEGPVRVEIPAGVAMDRRGEANLAAPPFERTYFDVEPPVLTLIGPDPLHVEAASEYWDPGATAYSDYDGNLTSYIVTDDPVDPMALGSYTVQYQVADSFGQTAEASRTVIVADTTPPEIALHDSGRMSLRAGSAFSDPGATATDAFEGDLTHAIEIEGQVNADAVGAYILQYRVSDSSGNQAETFRVVRVLDAEPPVITLLGEDYMTLDVDTPYHDPGATAWSPVEGDISDQLLITNPVNTAIPGVYTIRYAVMDAAGIPATELTRTVVVQLPEGLPVGGWSMVAVTGLSLIGCFFMRNRTGASRPDPAE